MHCGMLTGSAAIAIQIAIWIWTTASWMRQSKRHKLYANTSIDRNRKRSSLATHRLQNEDDAYAVARE